MNFIIIRDINLTEDRDFCNLVLQVICTASLCGHVLHHCVASQWLHTQCSSRVTDTMFACIRMLRWLVGPCKPAYFKYASILPSSIVLKLPTLPTLTLFTIIQQFCVMCPYFDFVYGCSCTLLSMVLDYLSLHVFFCFVWSWWFAKARDSRKVYWDSRKQAARQVFTISDSFQNTIAYVHNVVMIKISYISRAQYS